MDAINELKIVHVDKFEIMSKTAKRIPISDAKAIGEKCGYNQVIVVAWDENTGTTSVCTWGKSLTDCDLAAKGGNFVKKALGWPDELCHEKPARIKRLDKAEAGGQKNI